MKGSDGRVDQDRDGAICWKKERSLWFEYFEGVRRFWITQGYLMAKVHICLWSQLLFGVVFKSPGAALLRFAYLLSTINAVCKDFISMWRGWDKSAFVVVILMISSQNVQPCDCTLIKGKLFVSLRNQASPTWYAFIWNGWGFLNCRLQGCVICKKRVGMEGQQRALAIARRNLGARALIHFLFCPRFLSLAVMKLTKSNLREERVYLASTSRSMSIMEECQGKNSRLEA